MNKTTSLFRDDEYTGNERKYYSWLKTYYFPESEYIVYPNVALRVIINADSQDVKKELSEETKWIESMDMQWSTQNFFDNSSVDLCVVQKSDYLPSVAFEVDGRSHLTAQQQKRDRLKDLLFDKAGIPLRRLKVHRGQTESEKIEQLSKAVSIFNQGYEHATKAPKDAQSKRSILCGPEIREYYDLLNRMFGGGECVVFPNVALQSIFAHEQIELLETRPRRLCKTGLVDFCVVGAVDFRPVVAFSISSDELKSKVFSSFGLPLFTLAKTCRYMNIRSNQNADEIST